MGAHASSIVCPAAVRKATPAAYPGGVRAVVQRSDSATVYVAGEQVGGFIGPGLTVLVGVGRDDGPGQADRLAAKVWGLRIFDADQFERSHCLAPGGPRELSASDLGLPLLVISQFTLYGRTSKGRRPTWEDAAAGPVAAPLVDRVVTALHGLGAQVTTGAFGADMRVTLTNDGPFTVLLEV